MAATAQKPYTWGTGRRKTAVARVRIREGTGKFVVNELDADAYFPLEIQRSDVRAPMTSTEMSGRLDVFVNVSGSGKHSQSGAVALGLARALKERPARPWTKDDVGPILDHAIELAGIFEAVYLAYARRA